MVLVVGLNDLSTALIEAGNNLLNPHSSTEEQLLTLLDKTESLLKDVDQDQPLPIRNALTPSMTALVSIHLLSHPDSDVRVSVVSCLNEIMRITAPEAPYNDDQLKEIFRLTVESFEKLADPSSRSYRKAECVLDNVSKVKSSVVMLDLECDDLILEMFRKFLKLIRSDHSREVFSSMEMIMITIIDETEEVSRDLLDILLTSVKKENQNVSPMSWSLVEKVLSRCAPKLKPYIIEALKSTGTALDMYSPVVSSIFHSVFDTIKVHNVVNTEEKEADKTKSDREVAPSDSLEEKYVKLSRKENRSKSSSKRPLRVGTRRTKENDEVRNGNNSNLSKRTLKQVWSESTDAETELGVTGKRGRKPNSLMNPEEGYDISWISGRRYSFKTSSNKKKKKKGSSLGKVATKKKALPKETSPATSRSLTGSLKRSRVKMDERDYDSDSPSSPRLKKLASCFRDEEPHEEESNDESFEKLEINRKIGDSSKRARSQNSLEKSEKQAKKKPIVEARVVNSSGKKSSARLDAKRKNSEGASLDTPQSSKSMRRVSRVAARSLTEKSEKTSKSYPTRRQTTRKEESDTNGFGEDLVGKRVNIWWPLDKTFYEGVVASYSIRKKTHKVVYSDGDSEELNLIKERWELLEDPISADERTDQQDDEEIDLPEGIPLSDIIRRQQVKKRKNMVESVEPTSSSDVRSSSRTLRKKKDYVKNLNKQVKRSEGGSSKGQVVSEKSREGKNLKSLKELNAETDRREEQEESRDVDQESEDDDDSCEEQEESENKGEDDDDCSEKQEESENKGEEAETIEEEKQYPNSEVESEGDDSESEEEPKWRETEDMEDDDEAEEREKDNEVEEREEDDDEAEESEEDDEGEEKGKDVEVEESEEDDDEAEESDEDDEAGEKEKDVEVEEREEDEDEAEESEEDDEAEEKRKDVEVEESEEDDEAEEKDVEKDVETEESEEDDEAEEKEEDNVTEEKEEDGEAEEKENDNVTEEIEEDGEAEESKEDYETEEIEEDGESEEKEKDNEAEEKEKDGEAEVIEAEEKEKDGEVEENEDGEAEESVYQKRTGTSLSEMEKEEDEEKRS